MAGPLTGPIDRDRPFADASAEAEWVAHVNEVADGTMLTAESPNSRRKRSKSTRWRSPSVGSILAANSNVCRPPPSLRFN